MAKILISLICTVFFAGSVYSAQNNSQKLNEILEQVSKKEQAIKTIEIDFIQEIEFKELKETNSVIGKLKFKVPNKLIYQTFTSSNMAAPKQVFVSNGKKLWIYNPETKQVFIDLWQNWKGVDYFIPGMFNPKGSIKKLNKVYNFSLESEEAGSYLIVMRPKAKIKEMAQLPFDDFKVYLWISKTDFYPVKSKFVTENIISTTAIIKYKDGVDFKDDMFEFQIPQGVETLSIFK